MAGTLLPVTHKLAGFQVAKEVRKKLLCIRCCVTPASGAPDATRGPSLGPYCAQLPRRRPDAGRSFTKLVNMVWKS